MANDILRSGLHFYQSANADAELIKENFIIRLHEFDIIMDDIRRNPMKGSVQHYLLLGRRGSGKSTLLKRLQVEIESDEKLRKGYVAINLAEEQANIYRLFDLLEEIIEELEHKDIEVIEPAWDDDIQNYSRKLFESIHKAIEQSGKKVILLLDNIDRIFENLRDDTALLREMLLNFDDIKIIGGSTRMTEHFWKYNQPFYEFFRVLELKPLKSEEIKKLLLLWSEKLNLPELREFVEKKPGQLETVRILTDGLPRTLQFFVDILINNKQDTGYEYLKLIMDQVTPLYQERLNNLPPAQRKVVLQMAFLWETSGAKEIAMASKMNNSVVSAQLKQLTEKGIVEKRDTDTKNHLYLLAERFFNLWLIFTQGSPKDKRKAKYLTTFLENFYDGNELTNLALNHLKLLKEKKVSANKAVMISKSLAQSKHISTDIRNQLIENTLNLDNIVDELKQQIPPTTGVIWKDILDLTDKKMWDKALKQAETIEQEDGIKDIFFGYIHQVKREYLKAEHYYLLAIDKKRLVAMNLLAMLYKLQKKYELAEKYLLLAIENGNLEAIHQLALVYDEQSKYELAEKYYLLSVEKGNDESLDNLGLLYEDQKKYELAEKYYLQSVEKGHDESLNSLGVLYEDQKRYELAEKYYLQSVQKGYNESLNFLGTLYKDQRKYELAEKYFLLSIEKNTTNAAYNLALFYYEIGIKRPEALKYSESGKFLNPNDEKVTLWLVIKVWNGAMDNVQSELEQLIKDKNFKFLGITLVHLLIHHQINLVYQLFLNQDFGEDLKERFKPIYYATSILAGKDTNIELKIPPEIKETVDIILEEIKEGQKLYYK